MSKKECKNIKKFKFCQLDNEEYNFDFSFDLKTTSIDKFKTEIFSFFKKILQELNYNIKGFKFLKNNLSSEEFFDSKKDFLSHFKNSSLSEEEKFLFLVVDTEIHFFKEVFSDEQKEIIEEEQTDKIELRKNVVDGTHFKVAIQTYGHLIKEVEVYPEMTIDEFKQIIEDNFLVRKEYQELIYLIYKLNDDSKALKDYYIRPGGIIFLRGFYFPLIFVDFYERKNKKIVQINIAEKIKFIKGEIIDKMGLDTKFDYKLIFNGREMNENDFLIDYNVQKMQMIYFK